MMASMFHTCQKRVCGVIDIQLQFLPFAASATLCICFFWPGYWLAWPLCFQLRADGVLSSQMLHRPAVSHWLA